MFDKMSHHLLLAHQQHSNLNVLAGSGAHAAICEAGAGGSDGIVQPSDIIPMQRWASTTAWADALQPR